MSPDHARELATLLAARDEARARFHRSTEAKNLPDVDAALDRIADLTRLIAAKSHSLVNRSRP